MLDLIVTKAYKRSYKLMARRGYDMSLLDEVIAVLREEMELAPKYRDHALHGKHNGYRECHVEPDWLLVYLIRKNALTLTLIETGTHSDIFE